MYEYLMFPDICEKILACLLDIPVLHIRGQVKIYLYYSDLHGIRKKKV